MNVAGMCCATTIGRSSDVGKAARRLVSACGPPVELPMASTCGLRDEALRSVNAPPAGDAARNGGAETGTGPRVATTGAAVPRALRAR